MIKAVFTIIGSVIAIIGGFFGIKAYEDYATEQKWSRTCDGISVIESCTADDGLRYTKYLYHDAEDAVTEDIVHPAEPAKTHTVHHDAIHGTRIVSKGCIRTTISYKMEPAPCHNVGTVSIPARPTEELAAIMVE